MTKKTFGLTIIFIIIFALGAVTVYAQGPRSGPDNMPFGGGHHGMWGGHPHGGGMMWGGGPRGGQMFGGGMMDNSLFEVAAEALGLDSETLWNELRDGNSLLDIAETQGVDVETLQAALLAEMEAHMAEAVEAGYLSQEDADAMLSDMQENFAEHLGYMFGGGMFGGNFDEMPCHRYFQDGDDL